jgi:DNA-binding response OmpR family regulator
MHILVVEDDAAWLGAVRRMLEHAGHEVSPFADYRGALELIESRVAVDLLLTDIQLPEGTPHGLSLARMARAKRRGLPVLLMTGDPDLAAQVDEDLGAALIKPFTAELLSAAIAATMRDGA